MHHKIVILAGGFSSRMKKSEGLNTLSQEDIDQAKTRSKGLLGVGDHGRPFLDYLLYNVKLAGYQTVYIVIGPDDELFQVFYGDLARVADMFRGIDIKFALQHLPEGREKPAGTADALLQTLQQYPDLSTEPFSVCNSDNLYSVEALVALSNTSSKNAIISYNRDDLQFPADRIAKFAVMRVDSRGFLVDIAEKPSPETIEEYKDHRGRVGVNMNAFKFDGGLFYGYLENCPLDPIRNEKELPTALLNMIKEHPQSVLAIPFAEHVPDLSSPEDIATVRAYLKENYQNFRPDFSSRKSL